MSKHKIEEIGPDWRYASTDKYGDPVNPVWCGTPTPDGWDPMEPETHSCGMGDQCASSPPASIGSHVVEVQDTYDSGHERIAWLSAWIIDNRWVVCEDCSINIEEGDLVFASDKWTYVEPATA